MILAAAMPVAAMAVPASRKPVKAVQPDGTAVTIYLHGDERQHYATDIQGYPVEKAADGYYRYIGVDGQLTEAVLMPAGMTAGIAKAYGPAAVKPAEVLKAYLDGKPQAAERQLGKAPSRAALGNRKVPVLLVEFPDASFTLGTKERFEDMMNKQGYDYDGATGSCLDYFSSNSGGQFTPEFDVYGPVTLDHPREYYGRNDTDLSERNLGYMIKEACQKLDAEIDFTQYDYDGDGTLDYVYVYYAGMGEHDTGQTSLVWPQSWAMSQTNAGQFQCDGVTIEKFATSNELQASGRFVGIGIFVHEFSHVLGLPDLYATTYNPAAFTPGEWSVLDYGPYNNEGRTPPNYSAYERSALGWLNLKELDKPADVTLRPIPNNEGYRISTDRPDEYYVMENRQQEGWDKYIPGHGMLVWHIDYDAVRWSNNLVNTNAAHQYVDIVEADNILTDETRAGDAFPGTRHVAELTDDTSPAMLSWSGARLNKPLTAIEESADGVVTFKVMGGKRDLQAPGGMRADAAPTSIQLAWTPCADCDYQLVDVYTKTSSGEKEYAEGYKALRLKAGESALRVEGLQPSTEYFFMITSCTDYEQAPSEEFSATTMPPTFDMLRAETAEPTDVESASFTARWKEMDGADGYELTVKKRTVDATPRRDICDFTGKTLPDGWQGRVSSYFSASGYYGENAPAASMAESGQYVESGQYGSVRSLSLWMRTMSYSSLTSLKVMGWKDGAWTQIDDVAMPLTSDGGIQKSWQAADETLPDGVTAVRLELSTTGDKAGRLLLDDVRVDYTAADVDEVFADFDGKDVGRTTSCQLSGLDRGGLYLYTVRGVSGGVRSIESEARLVQLGASSGIDNPLMDGGIVVSGNTLSVYVSAGSRLTIASVDGATLMQKTAASSGVYSIALGKGVYVVRVADRIYKVKI